MTYVEWGNEPLSLPLHYNFLFALCSDSVVIKKKRRRYFYVLVFLKSPDLFVHTRSSILPIRSEAGRTEETTEVEGREEGREFG